MKSIPHADIHKVVKLKEFGYKSVDVCSQYEVLRLVCDESDLPKSVVILFSSGKLLIQTSRDNERNVLSQLDKIGVFANADDIVTKKKENTKKRKSEIHETKKLNERDETKEVEKKEDKKEEETIKEIRHFYHSVIGSDESLKGDSFGGIVVAAVFADENIRKKLIKLKVCDSKLLSDDAIRRMAPLIMECAPHHVENIYPSDYNKFEVTPLLNRLHKVCFEKIFSRLKDDLAKKNAKHIVDKFPGCKVGDVITEKAESKYIEVAAASIVARFFAVLQIEELSRKAGFLLPFGSAHVENALKKLKEKSDNGEIEPKEFVKINFSNVRECFRN